MIANYFTRKLTTRQKEALQGYLFISPWFVGFLIFTAGPLLASLYLSFTQWSFIDTPSFIGLENYQYILEDPIFKQAVTVTVTYTLFSVPGILIWAFCLAWLMTRSLRGMRIFRTIYYLPAVIGGVPMALLWTWVFDPDNGILNHLFSLIGITGPNWLQDPTWALRAIIIISLWNVGFPMIVFIAGIQNIPKVLYEVAILDGANTYRKLRHVTLPMLSPTILFLLVTQIIASFQVFDVVYVISQGRGGPLRSTLMYLLYFYQNAFDYFDMGYASALVWVLFLAIMVLTLLIIKSSSVWVYYEAEVKK